MVPGEMPLDLERKFLFLHYSCVLLTLCSPAVIMSAILSPFGLHFIPIQFVLSWLRGIPFENGLVLCAHVSWRLASDIVADENRLVKFPNASLASCIGLHEKTCLLCEQFDTQSWVCEYL